MRYLQDSEEKDAKDCFNEAVKEAIKSSCKRDKCGCVIYKNKKVIGRGFNSPPGNKESQRRCDYSKESYDKNVIDKTCCVHAEQRAIMDALAKNSGNIKGAILYFTRVNDSGELLKSGKPYCTICSKMALDAGIANFVLWHDNGICSYDTEDYNSLSFNYKG